MKKVLKFLAWVTFPVWSMALIITIPIWGLIFLSWMIGRGAVYES